MDSRSKLITDAASVLDAAFSELKEYDPKGYKTRQIAAIALRFREHGDALRIAEAFSVNGQYVRSSRLLYKDAALVKKMLEVL